MGRAGGEGGKGRTLFRSSSVKEEKGWRLKSQANDFSPERPRKKWKCKVLQEKGGLAWALGPSSVCPLVPPVSHARGSCVRTELYTEVMSFTLQLLITVGVCQVGIGQEQVTPPSLCGFPKILGGWRGFITDCRQHRNRLVSTPACLRDAHRSGFFKAQAYLPLTIFCSRLVFFLPHSPSWFPKGAVLCGFCCLTRLLS